MPSALMVRGDSLLLGCLMRGDGVARSIGDDQMLFWPAPLNRKTMECSWRPIAHAMPATLFICLER
jgi:hypothetical protein